MLEGFFYQLWFKTVIKTVIKTVKNHAPVVLTPFLTAPARVQYFTEVRPGITEVQP